MRQPTPRRGRRTGASVVYTPEQTARYQSQYLRFKRAEKGLKEGKMIFLQESPLIARFKSDRSPVGYWEVNGLNSPGVDLDARIEGKTFPNTSFYQWQIGGRGGSYSGVFGPSGGGIDFVVVAPVSSTFAFTVASETPDLDVTTGKLALNSIPKDSGPLTFKYGFQVIPPGVAIIATARIQTGGSTYEGSVTVAPFSDAGGEIACPPVLEGQQLSVSFSAGPTPTRVRLRSGLQVEGLNLAEAGGGCNCPDKTRMAKAIPQSTYLSEKKDRDWTESNAGTPDKCWHEIALILATDPDSYEVPTDYPYGEAGRRAEAEGDD